MRLARVKQPITESLLVPVRNEYAESLKDLLKEAGYLVRKSTRNAKNQNFTIYEVTGDEGKRLFNRLLIKSERLQCKKEENRFVIYRVVAYGSLYY